jgi:hypothetical protein
MRGKKAMKTVWIVWHEKGFWGVFSSKEKAKECLSGHNQGWIEEVPFDIDKWQLVTNERKKGNV